MKRKENENPQRNSFQLTINNPLPDYSHKKIKGILHTQFKTLKFYCMADEVGEQGTEHTHIYIIFSSRVRWNTVKKHFPTAHIEIAHATATKNVEYIKKIGKWEETEKSSTRVEGTYEEWGTIPTQKGTIPEMEVILRRVKSKQLRSRLLAGKKWNQETEFEDMVFTSQYGAPVRYGDVNRTIKLAVVKANIQEAEVAKYEDREPYVLKPFSQHCF